MPTHRDDDWLSPDPTPPSVYPPAAPFTGVLRADDPSDRPDQFDSLIQAILAGPPRSPEAQIRAKGVVLANANEERAEWSLSPAGFARVEAEAHGREEYRRETGDDWERDAYLESISEVAE